MESKVKKQFQGKRIFKSRKDRMIDGVCGGAADYLGMDVTLIRALWVVSIFINGLGIIAYILFMIFVPINPDHLSLKDDEKKKRNPAFFIGLFLIIFGGILLLREWNFPFLWPYRGIFRFPHWWGISWDYIWPLLLIVLGIGYILFVMNKGKHPGFKKENKRRTGKLFRTPDNKIVGGVCGGIGQHLGIDPTIIRILYVVLTLVIHIFPGVLLYIVLLIVIPEKSVK